MSNPTPRQLQVLRTIESFAEERGMPPTLRELSEILHIKNLNGVQDHLRALSSKGLISWERGKGRTIRILPSQWVRRPIPVATPVILEKRCDCGAALFGVVRCPVCKRSVGDAAA